MLIFNDLLQLRNKKKKNKYSWKEEKLYRELLRNELKQKIVVIYCTKKEHRCLFLMTYYNSEIKRKENSCD